MDTIENIELSDNFDNGPQLSSLWSLSRLPKNGYEQIDAPNRLREKAIILTVHPGDFLRHGPGPEQTRERCELAEKYENIIQPGTNIWYGLSFYIPEDFLVVDNRLVIAQWRTSKTTELHENPPLALRYINDELLFTIKNENDWIIFFIEKKPKKGVWHNLLVNYCWGKNHIGHCTVILNGGHCGRYEGHIGYDHLDPTLQFRFGLYRDGLEIPQSLIFSRFRRGLTREYCEK